MNEELHNNNPVQEPVHTRPKKKTKSVRHKVTKSRFAPAAVVLVIALIPTFYFYNKNQQSERRLKDPNTANKVVIDEYVKKVSKHILLPADEQPTLASVSDVTKVKDQPFFTKAENGDKVLVYTQARKAILYRPNTDLIIEVAPLNVGTLDAGGIKK